MVRGLLCYKPNKPQIANMSASSSSPQAFARPLRRVTRARDADEHARNLSQWDQRYDQLSPGAFSGEVTELWLPNSQIFVERANQQLRQTCAAWPRSVWFGIPDMADGLMSMGGKQLSSQAVCIRDGGAEFDLLTAPDFDLFGVVVDRERFASHLSETRHLDLDRLLLQGDVRDMAPGRKEHLCRRLANILSDANSCASDEDSVLDLQGRIFEALAGVLTSQDSRPMAVSRTRIQHQQIVDKLRQRVLGRPDAPPNIAELCEQLHISRRALQNCVEDVTGLPPLAYVRCLRLNEVRRLLRSNTARPISCIAYDWGFSHLSQFAQDYRRQFGELPSETLRG
jgi:AraC family ethanolamine operon transcriptional activator